MARTKFTGPKPQSHSVSQSPEAANNGMPFSPVLADGDMTASPVTANQEGAKTCLAAKRRAQAKPRVSRRTTRTTQFSREVMILYGAMGIRAPAARMPYTRLMKKIAATLKEDEEDRSSK